MATHIDPATYLQHTTLTDGTGDALAVILRNPDGTQASDGGGGSSSSSGTLYDGTLGATTSAAAIGSQACSSVTVQADPANTVNVLVGSSGSQHYVLAAGDSITYAVTNVNLIYAKSASATATVNWNARA